MPIHVLDPTVAAQIAAGEVVERPASVAKELIENALDAGAQRISVEVRGGGLRELKIQDDGCGIPSDEVELAFQRHATSKLQVADDLWAITTLGFRGEALPSIASVAQVICITRAASAELGTELRIAGGEVQSRSACGCPRGTTLVVRNLFYNVPVRREFLRSEATEANAVATAVTQYALAYPEVRFTLLLDGRLALQTSGTGDLREVLVELYGLDVARQLLPVEAAYGAGVDAVQIRGMASPPGVTRSSRGYLHVFVNRRAIQPRGPIVFAIEEAYHTLLMKGRHPLAVIDLRVHPRAVDVNVHPTKSEVKFRDPVRVLGVLGRAVREALVASNEARLWDVAAPPLTDMAQRRFDLRRLGGWDGGREPAEQAGSAEAGGQHDAEHEWNATPGSLASRSVGGPPTFDALALPLTPRLPALRAIGQVALTYIIADSPEGMCVIDQHAAHERVVYERLLARRGSAPIESQNLLIPQTVEVPPGVQQLLLSNAEDLRAWGFVIEDFGVGLRVRAIPDGLEEGRLAAVLLEVADHLAGRGGSAPADWAAAMAATLACHSAVRAGQPLSAAEMHELITQLAQCDVPHTCPHGRPTLILLSTGQLERQFGRAK